MRVRLIAMSVVVVWATISATTGSASTTPVVTFYTDKASFLAAISSPTVHNFEGIVADGSNVSFGASYHTGSVTFTSPINTNPVSYRNMLVVGKNSQTLGAPFDSAILIPNSEPSSMVATFDGGSNVTAVGGYFLNLFGNSQTSGGIRLIGSSGLLDLRSAPLGIATSGKTKTFFGYTVFGDTISSLTLNTGSNAPVFDDFTYGNAVPEPSSCILLLFIAGMGVKRNGRTVPSA
jgi:hypothetical protein